jgi:exopolysaccharide biosynthesis polyprenyl glycosylphosphotransferase
LSGIQQSGTINQIPSQSTFTPGATAARGSTAEVAWRAPNEGPDPWLDGGVAGADDSSPWWPRVRAALVATDLTAMALAIGLGSIVRLDRLDRLRPGLGWSRLDLLAGGWQPPLAISVSMPFFLIGCWLLGLSWSGGYTNRVLGVGVEEYKRITNGSLRAFGAITLLSYALDLRLGRSMIGICLPAGIGLLVAGRYLNRRFLVRARVRGRQRHRVLIVGSRIPARRLMDRLLAEPYAGFQPVAVCLDDPTPSTWDTSDFGPVRVLGGWAEVAQAARLCGADTVMIAGGPNAEQIKRTAWSLEGAPVDLVVSTSLADVAGPRISVRPVSGLPLLYVDQPQLTGGRRALKALLDLAGAAALVTLLAPLLLVVGILIKMTSPGPAVFRQQRIGLGGREFQVYKFRTMYRDAEARLAELTAANESDGLLFKIKEDPRITPLGRFLRATSIDELPQLLNVLNRTMSLVGPRPLPVRDSDFQGEVRRRLLVRPGITGLWQISGRSEIGWDEAVRLDLSYVENWSLGLDVAILLRTVVVLTRRDGAW